MEDIPREVVELAAKGDIAAFEEIYRATSSFVYNTAFQVTRNREDAEEVTQDVFLKVYKELGRFEFRSSLRTWIYRIAVNLAINAYKKSKRRDSRQSELDENMEVADARSRADDGAIREEDAKLINSILDTLNPDHRACVVLRNIEGLSYQEIADTLKININTVRTRLKRARERMIEVFKKRGI